MYVCMYVCMYACIHIYIHNTCLNDNVSSRVRWFHMCSIFFFNIRFLQFFLHIYIYTKSCERTNEPLTCDIDFYFS